MISRSNSALQLSSRSSTHPNPLKSGRPAARRSVWIRSRTPVLPPACPPGPYPRLPSLALWTRRRQRQISPQVNRLRHLTSPWKNQSETTSQCHPCLAQVRRPRIPCGRQPKSRWCRMQPWPPSRASPVYGPLWWSRPLSQPALTLWTPCPNPT